MYGFWYWEDLQITFFKLFLKTSSAPPQFISPSIHSLHVCCCSCHFCRFSFHSFSYFQLKKRKMKRRTRVKINSLNSEQLLCNRKCWFSNYVVMRDAHKLRELNNRVFYSTFISNSSFSSFSWREFSFCIFF